MTFDILGVATIDALPKSDYGALIRRGNKVATLDGGVATNDFGFNHADRIMGIKFKSKRELDITLRYLVENYSQILVSMAEGVFTAIPSYKPEPSESTLTLSITGQLT